MVEAVKSGSIKARANELPFLRSIGEHAGFIAQTLAGLSLHILVSPDATGFILTDNPFTIVPAPGDNRVGIANWGTFTYIPITRKLCLRYGMVRQNAFIEIQREDVRLINQTLAVNSERFVMGPDRMQVESVVRMVGFT